jgi:preprotein translocase subunit SecD
VQKFSKAVFGQSNQPLYMFLDRPTDSVILINQSLLANTSLGLSPTQTLQIMQNALNLKTQTIPVISFSNNNASMTKIIDYFKANKKYTTTFASYNINPVIISDLRSMNITVKLESNANMTPTYTEINSSTVVLNNWNLVGLLSSPILNPAITNGSAGDNYEITGISPATESPSAQFTYATNEEKTITSILNGGALPVAVLPGVPTTVPPTLGKQALYVSAIAGILAVLGVSIFITIRYKKLFLILPILLTTFAELFIIVSIIGLVGTIDLAAVAGMIGVVGTGVDAQIIITDEILTHGSEQNSSHGILSKAFYIVWADAILLVIAMLPLFFSTSLVDVIGFSEATIIGAMLGVLVTRPVYGLLISKHFGD